MSLTSGAVAVLPALTGNPAELNLEVGTSEEVRSTDYGLVTDPKNVEKFLKDYFADAPLLAKIAYCESRNRHFDKNGLVLQGKRNSYDRGVMQINLLYHEKKALEMGLDLHNIDDNVAYARYLYQKQGAKPWQSSSACWSKPLEIAKK